MLIEAREMFGQVYLLLYCKNLLFQNVEQQPRHPLGFTELEQAF